MALSAMLVGDTAEAIHHIENITEIVTGEHLGAMNDIVRLLEAEDIDAARQMTLEMLAGFVPGTTMESFGIAPDGASVVVSTVNTNVDIYLASGIPGLAARQNR